MPRDIWQLCEDLDQVKLIRLEMPITQTIELQRAILNANWFNVIKNKCRNKIRQIITRLMGTQHIGRKCSFDYFDIFMTLSVFLEWRKVLNGFINLLAVQGNILHAL